MVWTILCYSQSLEQVGRQFISSASTTRFRRIGFIPNSNTRNHFFEFCILATR
jgi:hypothetical protein